MSKGKGSVLPHQAENLVWWELREGEEGDMLKSLGKATPQISRDPGLAPRILREQKMGGAKRVNSRP